jgi:hypothetical protein
VTNTGSWGSAVGIGLAKGWMMGWSSRLDSVKNLLFSILSRLVMGPIMSSIEGVLAALSLGINRLVHEPDYSLPTNAEVKKM